jgi:tRNA-dihydrouridine synthase 3
LRIPLLSEFKESPPYGPDLTVIGKPGKKHPNIDFSTKCPVHEESGECRFVVAVLFNSTSLKARFVVRYGYKCRYMGGHALEDEEGNVTLVADEDKKAQVALTSHEINFVGGDVQKQLRSKKVCKLGFGCVQVLTYRVWDIVPHSNCLGVPRRAEVDER